MKGDLKKDFAGKVQKITQDTLDKYSLEIGLAIGPVKVYGKLTPERINNNKLENER